MENTSILTQNALAPLKKYNVQQVLLDKYGFVLENDEKILKTHLFRQKSIAEICPFFESIFPSLQLLKEDVDEIYFPFIGLYIEDSLKGYFHYTFSKVRYQEQIVFVWTIIKDENTENRQNHQQNENNRILQTEATIQ
jgi:hypothetical protein